MTHAEFLDRMRRDLSNWEGDLIAGRLSVGSFLAGMDADGAEMGEAIAARVLQQSDERLEFLRRKPFPLFGGAFDHALRVWAVEAAAPNANALLVEDIKMRCPELAGVTTQAVSQWKGHRVPDPPHLAAILDALELDPDRALALIDAAARELLPIHAALLCNLLLGGTDEERVERWKAAARTIRPRAPSTPEAVAKLRRPRKRKR